MRTLMAETPVMPAESALVLVAHMRMPMLTQMQVDPAAGARSKVATAKARTTMVLLMRMPMRMQLEPV
jgi:hypothetical protein